MPGCCCSKYVGFAFWICQINSRSLLAHYECKVNSFDPGECLRVGRTVSGWARSGSFCDRNFCRQLTNFFGQSYPWPLVCGLSTIRLSQPPWWTVFSNRGLVWACCQLWLFENFYDYLHSFFRWSGLPCKSTRASSRLNIICWVSENCCSKTPG